jgi:prepilin-type N-terminal cleavage/methylation domain-containing protein
MQTPVTANRAPRHPGFTLIELLVVIGIIAVLIGVLIPVVSNVRQSAYAADTQNTLSSIQGAIERYYQEYRAYPGPVSNSVLNNSATAATSIGVANNLTSSENLVLALLGGLNANSPQAYDPTLVGGGPTGHPGSYMDMASSNLSDATAKAAWLAAGKTAQLSVVPEFTDRFPDAMPILYLRANAGNNGVVSLDNTTQYNASLLAPYNFTVNTTTDFTAGSDQGLTDYFANPAAAGTPRQKDGYILITAGKDRKYGTKDDITNFGRF